MPEVESSQGELSVPTDVPASVVPGATESDDLLVFLERDDYVLPSALGIETNAPGVYDSTDLLTTDEIASGQSIDSFYVHNDHPEGGRVEKSGSVTFERPVLGVIATSDAMVAANGVLAVSELTTEYPESTGSLFGLELDSEPDLFEVADDGRTVVIELSTGSKSDSFRVILAGDGPD